MNLDVETPENDEDLEQVAAMVDVVFILLAFFVLSVQFHGGEREMAVGHKEAATPSGAANEDFPPQIVVRLTPGAGGASVQITLGNRRLRDDAFEQVTAALADIDLPQIPVVLAADPSLNVQQVALGVDAVLASPMKRLSLSRLGESGP